MANDFSILIQLGMRIAYLRKERKMSQLTLSIDSGIAKSYLCELEKGRRNPSVIVLSRISEALGITLEELFKGISPIEGIML